MLKPDNQYDYDSVNSFPKYELSKEDIKKIKENDMNELQKLPITLFFNPWKFWEKILTSSSLLSFAGYFIIFIIIGLFFYFFNISKAIIYSIVFLIWIGPVLLGTPLFLSFALYNTLNGDFLVPIGCVAGREGHIDCI